MKQLEDAVDEKKMARIEAIILSMTVKERQNPDVLNPSRKRRIANGAGVDISEVNRLVKQFEQSRKMMKQMSGMMSGKGKGRFGKKRNVREAAILRQGVKPSPTVFRLQHRKQEKTFILRRKQQWQ
mgnify:CR=1 FL=1